jgi:ATP-binding cassette subfamily B multidrug efflux pump
VSEPFVAPTLRSTFLRNRTRYALGGVMLALFQWSMNRIDWASKHAIDALVAGDEAASGRAVGALMGFAVGAFVTRVASRWYIFNAGRDAEYDLRAAFLRKLHSLGTSFYRTMGPGEIMSRATNDLVQVRLLLGFGILNVINVFLAFASALQVMISVSPKLTLASLANVPILVLLTRTIGKQLYGRTRENQEALGAMSSMVQSNLAGLRVVRGFALDAHEAERFERSNRRYIEASLALARLRGLFGPAVGFASAGGFIVFFWYGAKLLAQRELSSGDFFAFWFALGRLAWPMVALGFAVSIVQRGRAGFDRLAEIFKAPAEIEDAPNGQVREVRGDVDVRGLSVSIGERAILRDVTFRAPAGKSLAIVGRTGSGKSTLAQALARMVPATPGTVLLDGVPLEAWPLRTLRSSLGYLQQDAFLFSTTVHRNVAFCKDDPDAPENDVPVHDALVAAQVLGDVELLPDGVETVVGERGVQLSGGQKQRIALARGLLWGPKVMILDDPFSAVDARTEAAILTTLDAAKAGRTLVLVTHRIAAAARCDRILVLDEGRVVAEGTHDELLAIPGPYRRFAEEQRIADELAALAESEVAS